MIRTTPLRHRAVTALAVAALLLRVVIPVGFMPSGIAGGWYLELCPDGLPRQVVVALFGEHYAHHGHHGVGGGVSVYHCDYGGGAAGAWLLDHTVVPLGRFPAATLLFAPDEHRAAVSQWYGFRSRAPPSSVRNTANQA